MPSVSSGATLQEFWDGKAYFELVRLWGLQDGTLTPETNTDFKIVVVGNTWYRFSNETYTTTDATCVARGISTIMREVVYRSADRGTTWSNRTVVVEPSVGTPYQCIAGQGDAYFDADASTWHYIFSCLASTGGWSTCHAQRASADPLGPYIADSTAIAGGTLFKPNFGSDYTVDDETAFQILDKVNGRYRVLFFASHTVSPWQYGTLALFSTADFKSFTPVGGLLTANSNATCGLWMNVPCAGVGASSILLDGGWYYLIAESSDQYDLACRAGEKWYDGILRTQSVSSPSWQGPPDGQSALIYPTSQIQFDGATAPCGVQYPHLFKDGSDIYIEVTRMNAIDQYGKNPKMGIYLYKLIAGAPIAAYQFKNQDPREAFVHSDNLSRDNLEAVLSNTSPISDAYGPGLYFNGVDSQLTLPNSPILEKNSYTISLRMKFDAIPAQGSAIVGGRPGAYWLTLYPSGELCGWINAPGNASSQHVCSTIQTGKLYAIDFKIDQSQATLVINSAIAQQTALTGIASGAPQMRIGGSGDLGPSFNGTLYSFKIYDYVTSSPSTPAPVQPLSCSFNGAAVANNASITAYKSSTVSSDQQCLSQVRACANGALSGDYRFSMCTVAPTSTSTATASQSSPPANTASASTVSSSASASNTVSESSASEVQGQQQLRGGATVRSPSASKPANNCLRLTRTLSRGVSGTDVTALQKFLYQVYADFPSPTGYFGLRTQTALQLWQKEHYIASFGTPGSTGYGATGPRTRAAIASVCK